MRDRRVRDEEWRVRDEEWRARDEEKRETDDTMMVWQAAQSIFDGE